MRLTIIAVLFALTTSLYAQDTKSVFSRMDVFELEWASDPQISPDGNNVVYARRGMDIMKDRRMSRLWLMSSDGSSHTKLTNREVNESQARWSPDGDRIAFVSSTDAGSEVYLYWIKSGVTSKLTQLDRSPRGLSWSQDGTQLSFSMLVPEKPVQMVVPPKKPKGAKWAEHPRVEIRLKHEADGSGYTEPGYNHIFVIPAEGGSPRQVTSGDYNHRGNTLWTKDGRSLIVSGNRNENWEYEWRNSELYSVSLVDGRVTALTNRNGPDNRAALSPNGQRIAYLGRDDKMQTYQLTKIYLMNVDGSGKKELKTNMDRSPSSISWDSKGEGLYFQYDDKGNTKIGHTTIGGKTSVIAANLGGTVIGRPYGGGSFSVSSTGKIAYTYNTPDFPADVAIAQKGKETQLITSLNKDLLPFRSLGKTQEIWYKSTFDGRDIQGWITTPPSYDSSKKYPLLVENHGGPISNYGDRFSPEVQLFAADGFVVFYPNPRGSTSYGEEFGNLLYHNYPGHDYNDVMDGVDAVLAKGMVLEDSLFVTGGSAGGIMSAWMIGKNNRFKAAAVVKPVMNWISKTLTADNHYGYANSRFPGQPWENIETYMKFSPISLVGNIQTPTMVMVGLSDLRTPLSESKQLYHALKVRKIETALVQIPGSYHNISTRPSQLITKTDHILAWFRKYRK